jgi:hypothetical protein
MKTDYMPAKDADFNVFFKNLVQYVGGKTGGSSPEWTHIPAAVISELVDQQTVWEFSYNLALKSDTPTNTIAKNGNRQQSDKLIRPFVSRYLHCPPVTNGDRAALGIDLDADDPAVGSTPIPTPDFQSETDAMLEMSHLVDLKMHLISAARQEGIIDGYDDIRSDDDVWGDPVASNRLRLSSTFGVGGNPFRSELTDMNKYCFDFFETDHGKAVCFCLHSENSKSGEGLWGLILSAVIP